MKTLWDSFKEADKIAVYGFALLSAVAFFAGRFDEIRLLEYWALMVVCTAASVYLVRHVREPNAKPALIALFLAAAGMVALVIYRQDLRHERYEVSYSPAFHNTLTDKGTPAIQVGLCILNPNDFPIFARIASLTANVGDRSGSYPMDAKTLEIPAYTNIVQAFSDDIELPPLTAMNSPTGVLNARVEYGRARDSLSKELNVELDMAYVRYANGDVAGFQFLPLRGSLPNNYALSPRPPSRCNEVGEG